MDKKKIINKICKLSAEFFGLENDPRQIRADKESWEKLMRLHKDSIIYKLDSRKNLIGWAAVVPTTKKIKEDFLAGKITERQILDLTEPDSNYGAIYICAAFVLPEYRRMGYAKAMLLESIKKIAGKDKPDLFYWAYTKEGDKLAKDIARETGLKIYKNRVL